MAQPDVTQGWLFEALLPLNEARFEEVAERAGARPYLTPKAPPMTRTMELCRWAGEQPDRPAQLRALLAPELSHTDALARWRAWAIRRLGQIPILGFQGTMRAPVDLNEAFVPLTLVVRDTDGLLGGGLQHRLDWTLRDAIAHGESEGRVSVQGLALVGLPGSGKTTLLKHAWGVCMDRGSESLGFSAPSRTPVFVRVASLNPDDTPAEMLDRALRRELSEHGYQEAANTLLQGPLLWLLDGLDEAGSLDQRRKLALRMGQAMEHRPLHDRYILTSRIAGWRDVEGQLHGRLRAWEVAPLHIDQVPEYILRWHQAVLPHLLSAGLTPEQQQEQAQRGAKDLSGRLLSSEWMADSRRERMVRNPLLLSILCLVNRKKGTLPDRRALLYRHALDTMTEEMRHLDAYGDTGNRVRHKGIPMPQGEQLLGAVAWFAHNDTEDQDVRAFSEQEAIGWMRGCLQHLAQPVPSEEELPDILHRAEEDCGLLLSTTPGVYQFSHLTFQEFLAAGHAALVPGLATELAGRAGMDRWEEPIRLAMSKEGLSRELLRCILNNPAAPWDRDRFQRLMRDCAKEAPLTPFVERLSACIEVLRSRDWGPMEGWVAKISGRLSHAEAEQLALRVMALFLGRALPPALTEVVTALAELPEDRLARREARVLLGRHAPIGEGEPTPGQLRTVQITGGPELILAWVPGGEFWMGATTDPKGPNFDEEAQPDEGPVRRVKLSQGFWLGLYPITNVQYRAFVRATRRSAPAAWGRDGFNEDEQPVTTVDWNDSYAFCAWLSQQLRSTVTLPSEAQWERAARGEDGRKYPWRAAAPVAELAVLGGAPPAAVGGRPLGAGPYGHQDLAGNVWEWCRDSWRDSYPTMSGVDTDPCHELTPEAPRVVRGGSWGYHPKSLRSAFRDWWLPDGRFDFLGLRVCILRDHGP